MKKFVAIVMGMALVFACMFTMVGCGKQDPKTVNEKSYEMAYEQAIEEYGEGNFELEPKNTRDGVVTSYKVIVNGETDAVISINFK